MSTTTMSSCCCTALSASLTTPSWSAMDVRVPSFPTSLPSRILSRSPLRGLRGVMSCNLCRVTQATVHTAASRERRWQQDVELEAHQRLGPPRVYDDLLIPSKGTQLHQQIPVQVHRANDARLVLAAWYRNQQILIHPRFRDLALDPCRTTAPDHLDPALHHDRH